MTELSNLPETRAKIIIRHEDLKTSPPKGNPNTVPPASGHFVPPSPWKSTAKLLAYLSAVCFLVGIMAPCFTMVPKLGGGVLEYVCRLFTEELEPRQFSLAGGIIHLLHEGELFIGGLILLFTILFPTVKLIVIFIVANTGSQAAKPLLRTLAHLGKWSMLDVFVIASMVICFKGFPGGSRINLEWGLYVFAVSVVLSMLATHYLKKHVDARSHATH